MFTKKKLFLFICMFSFILNSFVYSQEKSFSKFRVLLHSGERIEGLNGVLKDSILVGKLKNGTSLSIKRDEIRLMDEASGTQVFKGAAIGGGLGLIVWIAAVANVEADPDRVLKEDATKIGLTITAACVAVGALIGSFYNKWEKYPIETKLNFKPDINGVEFAVSLNF